MTEATESTVPPSHFVSGWTSFYGNAEKNGRSLILRPFSDKDVRLEFLCNDVRIANGEVMVKVGAVATSSRVPQESLLNKTAASPHYSDKCGEHGTMCVGRVEFCCESFMVLGPCVGYWLCPTNS